VCEGDRDGIERYLGVFDGWIDGLLLLSYLMGDVMSLST
jgi:hypothetical protein